MPRLPDLSRVFFFTNTNRIIDKGEGIEGFISFLGDVPTSISLKESTRLPLLWHAELVAYICSLSGKGFRCTKRPFM